MTSVPEIRVLPATAEDDAALMARLTELVNEVYATSETGLWLEDTARTTPEEVRGLTRAGQLAVAWHDGDAVGCVKIGPGEFGMLAADPAVRGRGIGRELVRFAETALRRAGHEHVQLELLVPREWTHPSKQFLAEWYTRLGYRVVRVDTLDGAYPALAPRLATPCDFVIYRKPLDPDTVSGATPAS